MKKLLSLILFLVAIVTGAWGAASTLPTSGSYSNGVKKYELSNATSIVSNSKIYWATRGSIGMSADYGMRPYQHGFALEVTSAATLTFNVKSNTTDTRTITGQAYTANDAFFSVWKNTSAGSSLESYVIAVNSKAEADRSEEEAAIHANSVLAGITSQKDANKKTLICETANTGIATAHGNAISHNCPTTKGGTNSFTVSLSAAGKYVIYLTSSNGNVGITSIDITSASSKTASECAFATAEPAINFPGKATYTQVATTAAGYDGTVNYTLSDNTCGASINETTHEVTVTQGGSVTVTATASETDDYASSSASYTLTVNDTRTNLTGAWSANPTFDKGATATIPTFDVTGGTKGTDYTVAYTEVSDANNILTVGDNGITAINTNNVGTATVKATVTVVNTTAYKATTTEYTCTVKVNNVLEAVTNQIWDFTNAEVFTDATSADHTYNAETYVNNVMIGNGATLKKASTDKSQRLMLNNQATTEGYYAKIKVAAHSKVTVSAVGGSSRKIYFAENVVGGTKLAEYDCTEDSPTDKILPDSGDGEKVICIYNSASGNITLYSITVEPALAPSPTPTPSTQGGDIDFDYSATGANPASWTQNPITVTTNATSIDSGGYLKSWDGNLIVTVAGTDALVSKVILTYQGTNRLPSVITADDNTGLTTDGATQTWENTAGKASVTFTLTGSPRLTGISVEYASEFSALNAVGYGTFSYGGNVQVYGVKAYKAALSSNTITCTEIAGGQIPAGNGVLLYGTPSAKVYLRSINSAAAIEGNDLTGSTNANGDLADMPAFCYSLSGSTFKHYTGATLKPNKAFFGSATALSNSLDIVFDGATAVEAIAEAKTNAKAPIKVIKNGKLYIGNYNVAGQQVK